MRTARSLILLPALCLLLAACGSLLPAPAPAPSMIDFGPGDEPADGDTIPRGVTLARVDAPRWLNDTGILYRQTHRSPNQVERYAHHVWAAPPPELLAEQVERMLDAPGVKSQPPEYRLELRLTRFEQVFTAADEAHIDARMTATLHHRAGEQSSRRQTLQARIDARPGVDGAVAGLPRAAHQLVHDLGEWLAREAVADSSAAD